MLGCAHIVLDPSWPTILHFHGNGEVVSDYFPDWIEILDDLGCNGVFAEYRGYGGSTGTPKHVEIFGDLETIRDTFGLEAEKTIVFGRSIGSIYAIEYAAKNPGVRGRILESGIHDVLERILLRATPRELGVTMQELREEAAEHLDHRAKLSAYEGSLLILHAEQDHLDEIEHGRRNHASASRAKDRVLVAFPQGDHNTIFWLNRVAYLNALRAFVRSLF